MYHIFLKEINSFFSSLIGYIVIGVFLIIISLFMWVFPQTSVLAYGYASMDGLFSIAPLILMFLIPAITMRSFAEETQSGTIELLATRPLKDTDIILGKYFACWALVLFALLPTLFYYYTIHSLGAPVGNIDAGGVWGSYIGLGLLAGTFVSIGLFASSLTNNQIIAFILGVLLCFLLLMAFDFISRMPIFFGKTDAFVESLGINYHYDSISRGLVDTRDVLYFASLITAFVAMTQLSLARRKF